MQVPIETLSLFPRLNTMLEDLLESLSPDDWKKQTIARQWVVKDVATHLLDGNFRRIALHRDGWQSPPETPIHTYQDLVGYLNNLNHDWVKATRRLSPAIIVDLLRQTNAEVFELFLNLPPFEKAVYAVSWAGETESHNWFDIAREYTERWLHQQQIRDAIGDGNLLTRELYHPFLSIFMRAWPMAAATETAKEGAVLKTIITGEAGGEWYLKREASQWKLTEEPGSAPVVAETKIEGNVAWKIFSKSLRRQDIAGSYSLSGDERLGSRVLEMVSVMA